MTRKSIAITATLAASLLAACASTEASRPANGSEQLRNQLTPKLYRAGVSDECIAQLDQSTLALMKSVAVGPIGFRGPSGVGFTSAYVRERNQLRSIARRDCPNL